MNAKRNNLKEIALLFLKLGCLGFGGPAVHIAMMHDEVVKKRGWMSSSHYLDMVGATNFIPGPNSTEMTMHCGQVRGGNIGLIVAGCCFILPAVVITSIVAWMYQQYGSLPAIVPFLAGTKPAVFAIIIGAALTLGKQAITSLRSAVLGAAIFLASALGVNEIAALFGGGFLGIVLHYGAKTNGRLQGILPFMVLPAGGQISLLSIFGSFLKIGAILYGSGYVLFAFLDAELVQKGLISRQLLTDAITVGQITPGPLFSSATFIGWQLGGWWGAAVASVGIFLPSFVFVGLSNPLIPYLRRSATMSAFLDAINIGSVALLLSVVAKLGVETVTDWRQFIVGILAVIVVARFPKANSVYVIMGGGALGFLLHLLPL